MTDRINQTQILVSMLDIEYVFVASDGETCYATVTVNGHKEDRHHETWPIRSKGFRRWLIDKYYACEAKPPSAGAIADALAAIEARAQYSGNVHPVHVRVAEHNGAIYLDLVNDKWEAVEVTPVGWEIVHDPPVKFRRSRGMCPLPIPICGGSLN